MSQKQEMGNGLGRAHDSPLDLVDDRSEDTLLLLSSGPLPPLLPSVSILLDLFLRKLSRRFRVFINDFLSFGRDLPSAAKKNSYSKAIRRKLFLYGVFGASAKAFVMEARHRMVLHTGDHSDSWRLSMAKFVYFRCIF